MSRRPAGIPIATLALLPALALLSIPRPAAAASGGPDAGGYVWRDSSEPGVSPDPALFNGPTTPLTLTDDSVQPVPLPFAFSFYGLPAVTTAYLSDNGWLAFANPASAAPINAGLPDPAPPDALAAFYWDDLDPTAGFASHGPILGGYGILMRATQKSSGSLVQVMVELYPTGRIRFAWILAGTIASVSIGLENENGGRGTQLLRDGAPATGFVFGTGTAVEFLPPSRLPCGSAPITCGLATIGSTATGTATTAGYGCSALSFTGREQVLEVDLADTSSLTVNLSGFAPRQLTAFLLSTCHEAMCIASGTSFTAPALRPGRYHIVIDGATAADDGTYTLNTTCAAPTIAVHSGWYQNPGEGVVPASPPFPVRGDPGEFALSAFPPRGDPAWTPTTNPNSVSFDIPSTLCAYSCGNALEFTYYRTCLWLPASYSELIVSAGHVDDGIAVRVNGSLVSTGQLGAYSSPNIAGNPALVPGALNDIEVIHVDDCCTRSVLRDLTFTVDGQGARADWVDRCQVQAAAVPVTATLCPGTQIQLDASPSSSTTCTEPLEYRWREGPIVLNGFSTDPTALVSPMATTTYTVDVLCPNGCGCQSSTDVTVSVSPAMVDGVPAQVAICRGGTADLGGTPTASGGTPPLVYAWTPPTWLDDATSPNPRATPPASTTYQLTVTDGRGCTLVRNQDVVVGGGLPASIANTLLGVRAGSDAIWTWTPVLDATSYNLKTDLSKPFALPAVLASPVAPPFTHVNAVPPPPDLVFYRIVGVGCGGEGL